MSRPDPATGTATASSGEPAAAAQITIEPVRKRRQRREFLRLPWEIYAADPQWVPPLLYDMKSVLNPAASISEARRNRTLPGPS